MSNSVDSEASKKDGALIPAATDRSEGSAAPAFFTEEALLRLEEGLRAARKADRLIVSTQIEPISESPPLAPSDQPKIHTEEPVPSRSWRRRKAGLLLCGLLLIVGAAALGVSLKARTGETTDAALVNIEVDGKTASAPPDSEKPRQLITNAKSSVAVPSPTPDNTEPGQSITNGGKSSVAAPSLTPDNDKPGQPITNAGKSSVAAPLPAQDNDKPGQTISNAVKSSSAPWLAPLSRHRPMDHRTKRKGLAH